MSVSAKPAPDQTRASLCEQRVCETGCCIPRRMPERPRQSIPRVLRKNRRPSSSRHLSSRGFRRAITWQFAPAYSSRIFCTILSLHLLSTRPSGSFLSPPPFSHGATKSPPLRMSNPSLTQPSPPAAQYREIDSRPCCSIKKGDELPEQVLRKVMRTLIALSQKWIFSVKINDSQ